MTASFKINALAAGKVKSITDTTTISLVIAVKSEKNTLLNLLGLENDHGS